VEIIVIGGVAAGPRAAARLKRLLPNDNITLVNDSEKLSYGACGLPYYASGDINDIAEIFKTSYGLIRDKAYFENIKRLNVLTPYRAERIDCENKVLYLSNLQTGLSLELPYDRLILATGASPIKPNIPGIESERVRTFSKPDDASYFRKLAEVGRLENICIVGAGFIGCELSEAFTSLWGIKSCVVEGEGCVLPRFLDREMGLLVKSEMIRNGVDLFCGTSVDRFEEKEGRLKIFFGDNYTEGDAAIVAVGFKPNIELAESADLEIGITGGIKVDCHLQTSDPLIYAAGDCVENYNLILDKPVLLPLGSIANRHGRLIANNIAGRMDEFSGVVGTLAVKVFDYNVAATGITQKTAEENGLDIGCVWGSFPDKAEYYPEWKYIYLKMVYEKGNYRLLGLQAVGPGDVVKRVDIFSQLLHRRACLDDLFDLEMAYSPPYSSALDPLFVLGCIAKNQEEDLVKAISPEFLAAGSITDGYIIIDVREEGERKGDPIEAEGIEILEIPMTVLVSKLSTLDLKGKKPIVVCHRGVRGYEVARRLKDYGFEQTSFLGGGMSFVGAMKEGIG